MGMYSLAPHSNSSCSPPGWAAFGSLQCHYTIMLPTCSAHVQLLRGQFQPGAPGFRAHDLRGRLEAQAAGGSLPEVDHRAIGFQVTLVDTVAVHQVPQPVGGDYSRDDAQHEFGALQATWHQQLAGTALLANARDDSICGLMNCDTRFTTLCLVCELLAALPHITRQKVYPWKHEQYASKSHVSNAHSTHNSLT